MARYVVHLTTVASTTVVVEADNKEAAIEAAYLEDMPSICAQCSGWGSGQNLELGDEWGVDDRDVYEEAE